jgi:hypothetical protein
VFGQPTQWQFETVIASVAKQSRGHTSSLSLGPGLLRFARNDADYNDG